MLRHPSKQFAYTAKVNRIENDYGLQWLIDYIAAYTKRVRKEIPGLQEWVFSLDAKRRGKLEVFSRTSHAFPYRRTLVFTFRFTVLDYTGPPLTFFLEEGVLFTEGEPDVEI